MTEQTTEHATEDQNTAQEAAGAPATTQETTEAHGDVEAQDGAQEAEEQQEQDEQQKPNAEAKKYRLRLRDAEAELESTRASIAALQDHVLTSALGEGIDVIPTTGNIAQHPDGTPKPRTVTLLHEGDLFTIGGVEKSDVFTDGALDTEKLSTAMGKLYASRPELFREGRPGDPVHRPISTVGNVPSFDPSKQSGGWAGVIQNR